MEGSSHGQISGHYLRICLEGLKKAAKTCQDNRSPGRDLNPGTPECEAEVLTTRARRSVPWSLTTISCLQHVYVVCVLISTR
jgi:hypothetical protein